MSSTDLNGTVPTRHDALATDYEKFIIKATHTSPTEDLSSPSIKETPPKIGIRTAGQPAHNTPSHSLSTEQLHALQVMHAEQQKLNSQHAKVTAPQSLQQRRQAHMIQPREVLVESPVSQEHEKRVQLEKLIIDAIRQGNAGSSLKPPTAENLHRRMINDFGRILNSYASVYPDSFSAAVKEKVREQIRAIPGSVKKECSVKGAGTSKEVKKHHVDVIDAGDLDEWEIIDHEF
ncbi:hypothetical protein EJ08DRAFT_655105 [Tothia fuscella]|uniref:Uncharacterized protein n=1 Tax=Tothia fuscella TaxID=1048955 RepID=A0A9P4P3V6_9PEZI|nr:hypothetical protein EJ08DRAFT_655105 [Tothia fuscella]